MTLPTSPRRSRISRRRALQALGGLGLGTMGLLSGGCTITKGVPPISNVGLDKKPAPGRRTNITVYSVFGGTVGEGMVKLAQRFEESQQDIGVRVIYAPAGVGGGAVQQKLFTAIAGDNPPDVAQLVPSQAPQWAELGIMSDLTDRYKAAGLGQDDFFAPVWESIVYKERIWQVQWDADPNFPFFWNKDLFEKSGLDPDKPPQTIEEVDEYSKKILKKSGANVTTIGMIPWDSYGASNSLFTWGFAHGATFISEDKESVTPDSEYSIKALEWIVNYAKSVGGADRVTVTPPGLQLHPFSTGNIGMSPLVAPNYLDITKNVKDMKIGTGLLPYQAPGADHVGAGAWIGGWGMFIPSEARHPDEAWEFIHWAGATAEGTKAQWETVGFPPGYSKAPVLEEIKNDPVMAPFYDVLTTATSIRPPIPVADFYFTQLDEHISKAVLGLSTPLEAMRTVKANVTAEWDRFRKAVEV